MRREEVGVVGKCTWTVRGPACCPARGNEGQHEPRAIRNSRTGLSGSPDLIIGIVLPIGTVSVTTPSELGAALRAARRARNLRLEDVALAAGVGVRFLSELERGKPTSRLAETLRVASSLGFRLVLEDPG